MKPRFTTRAMLVLMTLFALFFWYHINWIQQRQAAIASGLAQPGSASNLPAPAAPGLLWMFGEPGRSFIAIEQSSGKDQIESLKALFPESHVMLYTGVSPVKALEQ